MSRWTIGDDLEWSGEDHYDDILDAGLPLRNGLLVKTWNAQYQPSKPERPEDCAGTDDSLSGSTYIGIIVESRLIGEGRSMQYWQYLVNWPDGLEWEDVADLVMEHDWGKSYYDWLQETAGGSF